MIQIEIPYPTQGTQIMGLSLCSIIIINHLQNAEDNWLTLSILRSLQFILMQVPAMQSWTSLLWISHSHLIVIYCDIKSCINRNSCWGRKSSTQDQQLRPMLEIINNPEWFLRCITIK